MSKNRLVQFIKALDRETIYSVFVIFYRVLIAMGIIFLSVSIIIKFNSELWFLLVKIYELFKSGFHGAAFVFFSFGLLLYVIASLLSSGNSGD